MVLDVESTIKAAIPRDGGLFCGAKPANKRPLIVICEFIPTQWESSFS